MKRLLQKLRRRRAPELDPRVGEAIRKLRGVERDLAAIRGDLRDIEGNPKQ